MKKIILITLLSVGTFFAANAQSMGSGYKTSLGAKGYFGDGSIGGINIKHFLNNNNALEGSLLFRNGFFALEGLYEWHGPIQNAEGLQWYVGPGAMLGFYNNNNRFNNDDDAYFALKGIIGLDYKFSGAPINIALDVNPTFSLTPGTNFDFYAGLAFRFAF